MSYAAELRDTTQAGERRYGMTASEAHAAIDAGTLEETHDVCLWLMAADRLARWEKLPPSKPDYVVVSPTPLAQRNVRAA